VNVYLWVFPLQLKVAPQAEVPRVAAETSSLEVAKETTVERVVFDLAMEKKHKESQGKLGYIIIYNYYD
jgi:hypothetical protein